MPAISSSEQVEIVLATITVPDAAAARAAASSPSGSARRLNAVGASMMGIAFSGMGVGVLTVGPLSQALISSHGWRGAYLALGLPGDFESTGQVADQIGELLRFGLPFTWWNSYVQRVMAVSRADVQRVARQYLDPSRMTIVIVGDLAKIRPGIEATGIGPVEVRGVEGQPLP